MPVFQKSVHVSTKGRCDVLDITSPVARIVIESGIESGIVNVSGVGSTLGVTTLEFEPGCVADLQRALDNIGPANSDYAYNARWGDEDDDPTPLIRPHQHRAYHGDGDQLRCNLPHAPPFFV